MSDNTITVEVNNVSKEYNPGERIIENISMKFEPRTINVLMGKSGSGKSTLLNIIGTLDKPTEGSVLINGKDVSGMREKELAVLRNRNIGFIFQAYNLLQNLTAEQNVFISMLFSGKSVKEKRKTADDALCSLGLEKHIHSFPKQLSGGEQQRVAIARALAKNPKLLLCDEPTGALDYATGKAVLKLLQDTCREKGMTVVVITHNQALTPMADRIITVKNGTVSGIRMNEKPADISEIEW